MHCTIKKIEYPSFLFYLGSPSEACPRCPWWGCQYPAAARWCSCWGCPSPPSPSCSSPWSAPRSGCPSGAAGRRTLSCSPQPFASAPQSDLQCKQFSEDVKVITLAYKWIKCHVFLKKITEQFSSLQPMAVSTIHKKYFIFLAKSCHQQLNETRPFFSSSSDLVMSISRA